MVTMKSTMSADDAKGHFDEVLRRVENNEAVTIERDGEPKAVIIPVDEYRRLQDTSSGDERWRAAIKRSSEAITRATGGKRIDWNQIIEDMRDDRSEQLLENLR